MPAGKPHCSLKKKSMALKLSESIHLLTTYKKMICGFMNFSHFFELQGHEYQEVSGKCCGQCRQFACVVTLDSYPAHVLKVTNNFANYIVHQNQV